MIRTIALILSLFALTALSASAQAVSARASLANNPTIQESQMDATAPYSADAAVSRNGGSFSSSSTLSRQSTDASASVSGSLTAFGSRGANAEFGEARATVFDTWRFVLAETAVFAFSGSFSTPNPTRSNYSFNLTGPSGTIFNFSSGDGQALSKTVMLQPGTYNLEMSANNFADGSTPNDETNWSYTATVPEPASALLGILGAGWIATRRQRNSY
jgi:hypothetical protein